MKLNYVRGVNEYGNYKWMLLPLHYDTGYFKIVKLSCHIIYDTPLFICKIYILIVFMVCPCYINSVSGCYSFWVAECGFDNDDCCDVLMYKVG